MFETDNLKLLLYDSGRPQLTRKIRAIEQDILRMGALVERSFRLSHEALCDRNLQAAEQLPLLDKQVDRFYKQIEADCAAIMTLQAPVAQDLRCLSAFMQLVRDLEVAFMSQQAQTMLATSLVALAELDEVSGIRMKKLDDDVDNSYEHLYQVLASQKDVQGVVEPILLLGLAIRCLERMADHSTNIGERVAYIVTGQRP